MGPRFTNFALLVVSGLLLVTGVYGLYFQLSGLAFDIHRAAAWALVGLLPWKVGISYRSLRRGPAPTFDRSLGLLISLLLAAATLAVIAFAIAWMWRFGPAQLRIWNYVDTLISWHWILGLAAFPALAFHAWRRWARPLPSGLLSRRGFLRVAGLGAASVIGWRAAETLAVERQANGADRSQSGSREAGSFTGNDFPVTTGAGDGGITIDLATWDLEISGAGARSARIPYDRILELPAHRRLVRLDCTIGWYTDQVWRGPLLTEILELTGQLEKAAAVRLISQGGYARSFNLREAEQILLATHVGGQVLEPAHGFPLRAVVPSHRGWFWVKWLRRIEVLPAWED